MKGSDFKDYRVMGPITEKEFIFQQFLLQERGLIQSELRETDRRLNELDAERKLLIREILAYEVIIHRYERKALSVDSTQQKVDNMARDVVV